MWLIRPRPLIRPYLNTPSGNRRLPVQPLILQLGYELEGRHPVALTATRLSEFDLLRGQVRT